MKLALSNLYGAPQPSVEVDKEQLPPEFVAIVTKSGRKLWLRPPALEELEWQPASSAEMWRFAWTGGPREREELEDDKDYKNLDVCIAIEVEP